MFNKLAHKLLHLNLEASRKRKRKRKQKWGVNDLFKGGAPHCQQNFNANEMDSGSEDLQKVVRTKNLKHNLDRETCPRIFAFALRSVAEAEAEAKAEVV